MNDELVSGYDIRDHNAAKLTLESAWNTGKAFADWLPTMGQVVVVSTPPAKPLTDALIEGLRLQGRSVIDGGVGDKDTVIAHITTSGLSGGVVMGYDSLEDTTTIELYQQDAKLVTAESGLHDIAELAAASNFVPSAEKGELTSFV